MFWLWAILLLVILIVCWGTNLIGLPGNWLALVAACAYAWLMPAGHLADFGWVVLCILLLLAVLGEIIELAAGSAGARGAGASRRATALAMAGAIIGAIVGLFIGLPIPVVGQVLASLLFRGLGAMLGAMLGEGWKGRGLKDILRVGHESFWGRLLGTLGKVYVGGLMIGVAALAMLM
jgi:uncharacterized protein YqgC (DUF456 family)